MKTKRAYRYRVYPTAEQMHQLAQTFGCVRFVYNWGLSTRKTAYKERGETLSYTALAARLPALKQAYPWLAEVSSVPLQQALRHLDTAYKNFFERRADYPVFKKKHHEQAATYASNAFSWDGKFLTLAKMAESLQIVFHSPLPDSCKPSSVTVSKDRAERYFVSFLIEEEIKPLPVTAKMVGLDLGIKSMVVESTGQTHGNPQFFRQEEKKLAKAQRRLARKKKGSKNRAKARLHVARLHAHIADKRRDYQHQLSTQIVHENQVICVESLNVKGMVKNHALAKSISDVGWGEFVRQLEYKSNWYGRTFTRIDRFFPSSKTCSACGYVLETLPLEVREWVCPNCGVLHKRDENAAKNVLTEGLSALNACGGSVRPVRVKARQAAPRETGTSGRETRSPRL